MVELLIIMVTRVEVYSPESSSWISVRDLPPGEKGSVSQNLPDGSRKIYVFECASDDSETILYEPSDGIDLTDGEARVVIGSEELKVKKRIERGDEPYLITLNTDVSKQRRIMRLSHE